MNIGRITPSGVITEFRLLASRFGATGITAGPDGNLWFTEDHTDQIGRITPSGVITEFRILTGGAWATDITVGPDGNLWFTEGGKIGRTTPYSAQVTVSNPSPSGPSNALPFTFVLNDFSISVDPPSRSLSEGSSATYTVSTALVSGSPETVTLQASILGQGTAVSFEPASVTAGSTSTLTISTTTANYGTYTVIISGTAQSAIHATTATLTVVAPDYTLSGTVTSAAGPLVGAYVHVFGSSSPDYMATAISGSGGSYSVTLPEGSYKLWIQPNTGGYPDQWDGGVGFAGASAIILSANATENIVVTGP
jgi:hypothetical protein